MPAQEPAVNLKGHPTACVLVEPAPLAVADVIEELPDWIHAKHRPTPSSDGRTSIALRAAEGGPGRQCTSAGSVVRASGAAPGALVGTSERGPNCQPSERRTCARW